MFISPAALCWGCHAVWRRHLRLQREAGTHCSAVQAGPNPSFVPEDLPAMIAHASSNLQHNFWSGHPCTLKWMARIAFAFLRQTGSIRKAVTYLVLGWVAQAEKLTASWPILPTLFTGCKAHKCQHTSSDPCSMVASVPSGFHMSILKTMRQSAVSSAKVHPMFIHPSGISLQFLIAYCSKLCGVPEWVSVPGIFDPCQMWK